jgi:iron complex outermembrane receptor protein
LINGDPAPQGFNLDQLSPSQIERIEVIKAATADQSTQAIAGTINVILKETSRRALSSLRVGVSNGQDRPTGNLNYSISESRGPFNMSLPVSVFEWNRQVRNLVDRKMAGTDGQPALSEQLGTNNSWGWGYNLAPRFNYKISDEQTLSLATFFQKGYWNYSTDYVNRAVSGNPVFDDNAIQGGFWENRRGNLTWIHRFSEDQRIEIKAGVQQFRGGFDLNNLRSNVTQLKTNGNNRDDAITQAGKYSQLLGDQHTLTAGWDLETRERQERRTTTDGAGNALLTAFEGQAFEAKMTRQAFYIQDEWEISPKWQLYLGLRNERIVSESTNTTSPLVNVSSVTSPVAHVTYKFDPKSKDMVRGSLTRSYKAPGLNTMLARPVINGAYTNTNVTNTYLSPDRIGNPGLAPELATGLDIAYENYLSNDGIFSMGLFHRNLTNVVRNLTVLRQVSWANAPRWITQPQNFSDAVTQGVEFELRGRASDLMPKLLPDAKGLNIRTSVNFYRSSIDALMGPNNRLDGQQPWSANLGFDQRINSLRMTVGGNLSLTPGYDTRQTAEQVLKRSITRGIDVFAMMPLSPTMSFRAAASAGVQQFGPPNGITLTQLSNGDYVRTDRYAKPQLNLSLDMRL